MGDGGGDGEGGSEGAGIRTAIGGPSDRNRRDRIESLWPAEAIGIGEAGLRGRDGRCRGGVCWRDLISSH